MYCHLYSQEGQADTSHSFLEEVEREMAPKDIIFSLVVIVIVALG
jgi:hypothetical protein